MRLETLVITFLSSDLNELWCNVTSMYLFTDIKWPWATTDLCDHFSELIVALMDLRIILIDVVLFVPARSTTNLI